MVETRGVLDRNLLPFLGTVPLTKLGAADLDLRGNTGAPDMVVLEVLVARLSRLAPAAISSARQPCCPTT